jgi:hypothetical protein
VSHSSNFNNCQAIKNITSNYLSKQNSLPHSSNCIDCQGITHVTSNHIVQQIVSPYTNVSQVDNGNKLIPAYVDYEENGVNQFKHCNLPLNEGECFNLPNDFDTCQLYMQLPLCSNVFESNHIVNNVCVDS